MFLLLLAVWIILNGKITVEICVLGALISAALFYFMCRYMEYGLRKELLLFRTGLAKVMLADSITLTPGTITVSVENDRFCVHCLDRELAEGMEDSVFVGLLLEMEAVESRWM